MSIEQTKTLEALQIALQMEIDGKEYYLKAGRASTNEVGRKLFQTLAAEEDVHRQNFESIFKAMQQQKGWPEVKVTPHDPKVLKSVFAQAGEKVQATSTELESVQVAMDMENKTFDFYKERARLSIQSSEKQYYEALSGQERIHHDLLLDYYEYLSNPAQYFTMKEHHSLDGG